MITFHRATKKTAQISTRLRKTLILSMLFIIRSLATKAHEVSVRLRRSRTVNSPKTTSINGNFSPLMGEPQTFKIFVLLLALLLTAQNAAAGHSSQGVMGRIQAADQPFDTMQVETAYQLPIKTVLAKELYQGGPFRVLARKDFISRYRCSVCHTDKKPLVRDGLLFTHSDIKINHGVGDNSLECISCHDEQLRDFLTDKQGKKIDFDHSYQLCGQCHFRQKRDWLGGAHGKRETYWAGERVIWNCTTCHNPHSPAFPTKMPATYSLPLSE